jgi:recombination protein RecA
MPSANALRRQIEATLASRIPAALSPAPRFSSGLAPSGTAALDHLTGGFPVGAISELSGPHSSGRTSIALAFLAQKTQEGQACAWIDVNDALDPESAAANGVRLSNLLWIRCRRTAQPWTQLDEALRAVDLILQAGGFRVIVLDLGDVAPKQATRIPLATWFRFRQMSQEASSSLLAITQRPCVHSSADLVLKMMPMQARAARERVMSAAHFEVTVVRQRFAPVEDIGSKRKPVSSTWSNAMPWTQDGTVGA